MKIHNLIYVALVIFISGCAAPYAYVSSAKEDPEIVFGERSGDIGARNFHLNIGDADANKCNDFMNVGGVSNNSKLLDKTKTVRVPAGRAVAVNSLLALSNFTCRPGVKMFTPENNGKYSIDIGQIGNMCYLSIARVDPSGKFEEVKNAVVLPKCK